MPGLRRQILIRRAAAVLGAAGLTVVLAILLLGGSDSPGVATEKPSGVSQQNLERTRKLSLAEQVDQVMLVGFDGSSPGGKIAGELGDHQLGGLLLCSDNWRGADPGRS